MPNPSKRSNQTGWRIEKELDAILRYLAREEERSLGRQADLLIRAGLSVKYPEIYNRLYKDKPGQVA